MSSTPDPQPRQRYRIVRRVTLVGSVVDLVLGVLKIAVGIGAHSQSLIADGIHSLSDLATDFLVLVAARHAHEEADAEHPYGHGRIETAATVALGAALVAVAIGVGWDAGRRLFQPELLLHPGPAALLVALASIGAKEWIYRYTMRAARALRSPLLRANAWHSRSDAISSMVVLIGVGGTMAGLPYLDALAAIGVAWMIARIGWTFGWSSVRELIDTGLDPKELEEIRAHILSVDGVRELHELRTRRMGRDALVDVHLLVAPRVSVSEGHQIAETVRARLIRRIADVSDVLVHVDPEDDAVLDLGRQLPLRQALLARLKQRWSGIEAGQHIEDVRLHYLDGRVHVELVLPLEYGRDPERARAVKAALADAARSEPQVAEIRVLFE